MGTFFTVETCWGLGFLEKLGFFCLELAERGGVQDFLYFLLKFLGISRWETGAFTFNKLDDFYLLIKLEIYKASLTEFVG